MQSLRTEGLLDTGATGTGIRQDEAHRLGLRAKGQRRVYTANGMMMAAEYVVRIGLVCGDYTDPGFDPDRQQPYVFENEMVAFELQAGFSYAVLIGMNVIGSGDLFIQRDGCARLAIG